MEIKKLSEQMNRQKQMGSLKKQQFSQTFKGGNPFPQKNIASMLGLGNDSVLKNICDFSDFEERMGKEEMKVPSVILEQSQASLKMDDWNNIPMPVIAVLKIVLECLGQLEKHNHAAVHELKVRTEQIVKKFQQIEGGFNDKEEEQKKYVQKLIERHVDILDRYKYSTNEAIKQLQSTDKKLQEEISSDKEFYESKLVHFIKEEDIKVWTSSLLDDKYNSLHTKIDRNHSELTHSIKKIVAENLHVPGFVGEGQRFRNMREYIRGTNREAEEKFKTLERDFETKLADQVKSLKMNHKKDVFDLKQSLNNNVSSLKRDGVASKQATDDLLQSQQEDFNQRAFDLDKKIDAVLQELKEENSVLPRKFILREEFVDQIDELQDTRKQYEREQENNFTNLEGKFGTVYETMDRKIEQVERRCKIDAQRVAETTVKRAKDRGRIRSNPSQGQHSQNSGATNSHANLHTSGKVLVMNPSSSRALNQITSGQTSSIAAAHIHSLQGPLSITSDDHSKETERRGKESTVLAIPHSPKMDPVQEVRNDSKMSVKGPFDRFKSREISFSDAKDSVNHGSPVIHISKEGSSKHQASKEEHSKHSSDSNPTRTRPIQIMEPTPNASSMIESAQQKSPLVEKSEKKEKEAEDEGPPKRATELLQKLKTANTEDSPQPPKEPTDEKSNILDSAEFGTGFQGTVAQSGNTSKIEQTKSFSYRRPQRSEPQVEEVFKNFVKGDEFKRLVEQYIENVVDPKLRKLEQSSPVRQGEDKLLAKSLFNIRCAKFGSRNESTMADHNTSISKAKSISIAERKQAIKQLREDNLKKFQDQKSELKAYSFFGQPSLAQQKSEDLLKRQQSPSEFMRALNDQSADPQLRSLNPKTTLEQYLRLQRDINLTSVNHLNIDKSNTLMKELETKVSADIHGFHPSPKSEMNTIDRAQPEQASLDQNVIQRFLATNNALSQQFASGSMKTIDPNASHAFSREIDPSLPVSRQRKMRLMDKNHKTSECKVSASATSSRVQKRFSQKIGKRQLHYSNMKNRQSGIKTAQVAQSLNLRGPSRKAQAGGFTSVLENMRGHHDRTISERLRSAFGDQSVNQSINPIRRTEANVSYMGKKEIPPELINYEDLGGPILNQQGVLNTDFQKQNNFGFAAMQPLQSVQFNPPVSSATEGSRMKTMTQFQKKQHRKIQHRASQSFNTIDFNAQVMGQLNQMAAGQRTAAISPQK